MLLSAMTIITAAIVYASHRGGDGLKRHFKDRGAGISCIDTNDPSIKPPFRAHDRLSECPWICLHASFDADRQMVEGHRKGPTLQRLGCTNLAEAGAPRPRSLSTAR